MRLEPAEINPLSAFLRPNLSSLLRNSDSRDSRRLSRDDGRGQRECRSARPSARVGGYSLPDDFRIGPIGAQDVVADLVERVAVWSWVMTHERLGRVDLEAVGRFPACALDCCCRGKGSEEEDCFDAALRVEMARLIKCE